MSFADTRGKVEKIDDYFTHVRVATAMGLMLFNHKGLNAAPEPLRKLGTEVIVFQGEDMSFHVKLAPPRKTIPQRKAAPQVGLDMNSPLSQESLAAGPAVAAPMPKIPARRR